MVRSKIKSPDAGTADTAAKRRGRRIVLDPIDTDGDSVGQPAAAVRRAAIWFYFLLPPSDARGAASESPSHVALKLTAPRASLPILGTGQIGITAIIGNCTIPVCEGHTMSDKSLSVAFTFDDVLLEPRLFRRRVGGSEASPAT